MRWSTCALCPRLCRNACPVATGTGREAATPAVIAGAVLEYQRGRMSEQDVITHIALCTDCGGCQDHCHLHQPLPEALRELRGVLMARPPVEPLRRVEGGARIVAIEADERPFAAALAEVLGQPVARLVTRDGLGVAAIEHTGFDTHLAGLRERLADREVVITHGGVAEVLQAAEIPFVWLRDRVRDLPGGHRSCRQGQATPAACCGAAGPLRRTDPDGARRVGRFWLQRADDWGVQDSRCREHLNACGGQVSDPLDALLARVGA